MPEDTQKTTPTTLPAEQPSFEPAVPEPTVMPVEPKDMFADVDEPSVPTHGSGGHGTAQELSTQAPAEGYTFEEEPQPWYVQKKFIVLLLGVVFLLIIVIFGVQFALRFFAPQPAALTPTPSAAPAIPAVPVTETPAPSTAQPATEEQPVSVAPQPSAANAGAAQEVDTDGDGLLDSEEKAIGTNITLTDTDGDELSDREEFRVFGTDPLNPDTDGDTYLDGVEVRNGYNPKGEGLLFTIPTE